MDTIRISVTDFRGIEKADIEVADLALIAGTNAAGKTSATQAVAAALTGTVIPLRGLRKSEAGVLVRSGAPDGGVVVATADGASHVRWPEARLKTEGTPPQASAVAAGLESVATMSPEDRAKALMPYLEAGSYQGGPCGRLAGYQAGASRQAMGGP